MRNPELTQYYLQQMGVDTWLLRNKTTVTDPILPLYARGNLNAKLMIIADSPSMEDYGDGLLFSGKTGALLKNMLKSIALTEEDVYLTTFLRNNITAFPISTTRGIGDEPEYRQSQTNIIEDAVERMYQEIAHTSPDIIIVVGDEVSRCLLGTSDLSSDKQWYYQSIPVLKSTHPADLLQNPRSKKQAYADLLHVEQLLLCNA